MPKAGPGDRAASFPAWLAAGAIVLVGATALLGALVSANYAALSCTTLPDCNGHWWPAATLAAFDMFRPLAVDGAQRVQLADYAPFLHMLHRYLAAASALAAAVLGAWLIARGQSGRGLGTGVLVLLALQVALGVAAITLSLPLPVVVLHNGIGALLLIALVTAGYRFAAQRAQGVAPVNLAALIREVGRGPHGSRDLSEAAACELYGAMLDGRVPEMELGAIQIALRVKGEGPEELRGFYGRSQARLATLELDDASARPVVLPSYNGARHQANLTPLLALLLGRLGVPVLIHGAPDAHGRITTQSVLEALDIRPCRDLAAVRARLGAGEIAYAPVELLVPGLAALLATRNRLGLRSSSHSLAKLIDPFGGRALRVVSVSHPDYVERMGRFLRETAARALLLRGTEGEPFANPKRRPRIELFRDGETEVLFEAETGSIALPELPSAIDPSTTADWTKQVLSGRVPVPSSLVDQLGCCLYGAGRAASLAAARAQALRLVG